MSCLTVYEVTDSVGRTGGCVSEVLVCFQPTQGQLGSNRDAPMELSPPAFLPPFLVHFSPLRFSGSPALLFLWR